MKLILNLFDYCQGPWDWVHLGGKGKETITIHKKEEEEFEETEVDEEEEDLELEDIEFKGRDTLKDDTLIATIIDLFWPVEWYA